MSSYRVAPLFLIRAPGVPFEAIEGLATQKSSKLARELLVMQIALEQTRAQAEALLGSRESGLSAEVSRASRAFLRNAAGARKSEIKLPEVIVRFLEVASGISTLEEGLEESLRHEVDLARTALLRASVKFLPDYLLFGAGDFRERLAEVEDPSSAAKQLPPRNSRTRERERHLLLYLQRVCAKNDTFSQFGPSAWGTIESAGNPVSFAPQQGIAQRVTFLERWAAHNLAAALNQDVDSRQELLPRLNPNGRIEGETFLLADSGAAVALTKEMQELVARCDGKTPAYQLGGAGILEQLVADDVIRWEAEVPAMEPHAFDVLASDIAQWRDGPVRTKWLDRARNITVLPRSFAAASDAASRATIMAEARRLLAELGLPPKQGQRFLYAATNPITEECSRDCRFNISEALTDRLARDAQPWFDLWRDTYAFVASRVAEGLRALLQTAPVQNGALPLPAFMLHCASKQMPLTGHGIVALAHVAFQEVKATFRTITAERAGAVECELTAEDCGFVRRNFSYQEFDEYTYPSADLQLSASSFEAIGRDDYQWVVSELHPPFALLHHALYWSCPDKPALSSALTRTVCGRPGVHYGFFAADFTAHTTVHQMDALPKLMTFVAPQRSNPLWPTLPPAEVEVFVEEGTNDVAMRQRGSRKYLGSFARSWIIPLGFHPFHFGLRPNTPRLRCGKVIVQRRAWTVGLEELQAGNFTGISRDLVLAVEKLRADRDWPRHIYIRPTEQALRRSGGEGRDKDTKPVYIDLESYLSLEIFYRWLTKAGELEVTEMLPDPEHLCWQEADGRRTFELRTLIVPRS